MPILSTYCIYIILLLKSDSINNQFYWVNYCILKGIFGFLFIILFLFYVLHMYYYAAQYLRHFNKMFFDQVSYDLAQFSGSLLLRIKYIINSG